MTTIKINPPPLRLPAQIESNQELRNFFSTFLRVIYQLWDNAGGNEGGITQPSEGGTGVDNDDNTITVTGNLALIGGFSLTMNATGVTSVTFPTTGTLATLLGVETFENKTIDTANNDITINASDVSDFDEAVDDRVNDLLVEEGNIVLTYNDGANTLTVSNEYEVVEIDDTDSPYTATVDKNKLILADTTTDVITVNVPTAVGWKHKLSIQNVGTGTNDVTIDADGTETINGGLTGGGTSITVASPNTVTLTSNQSNLFAR